MRRGRRAAAAILAGVFFAGAHAAETRDPGAYLRLGPAVERIARLHAQAGQDVIGVKSRRALAEALHEFDASLRAALAAAPAGEARDDYLLLAMLWQDYREWVHRAASRETGRKVRERTEEMTWVALKGVRLMSDASRGGMPATALRASQASLASQRIAKSYLWRRWAIRDATLDRELREARENLPRALEAIAASTGLSAEQQAQVETAQAQWRFLADAAAQLDASTANARALEFACKAADHIQEALQKLY